MKITYDEEADAIYIRFSEGTHSTQHLDKGMALDYDVDGRLVGIEILDASRRVSDKKSLKAASFEAYPQPRAKSS